MDILKTEKVCFDIHNIRLCNDISITVKKGAFTAERKRQKHVFKTSIWGTQTYCGSDFFTRRGYIGLE